MSNIPKTDNVTIYLRCWHYDGTVELNMRYDNTIAEVKSVLKSMQIATNPEIIVDGKMCPDTYTVHDIIKYNLVIIERIPYRRLQYRLTFIVSALFLTSAIFKLYRVATRGQ